MMNLGPRPTFGEPASRSRRTCLTPTATGTGRACAWISSRGCATRSVRRADALVKQLARDEQMARAVIGRARAGL